MARPPLTLQTGAHEHRSRFLTNEPWRHSIAVVIVIVPLVAGQWLANFIVGSDRVTYGLVQASLVLTLMGAYGPLYLLLTRLAFRGLRGRALKRELQRSRPPRNPWLRVLLVLGPKSWAISVGVASVAAVLFLAISPTLRSIPVLIGASIVCVVGAWVPLLAVFAVEYARAWADGPSFRFPGDDENHRSMTDFTYLSTQVSTTFATSDVGVLRGSTRSTVSVQSITAFAYSTVIVALLVSLQLTNLR